MKTTWLACLAVVLGACPSVTVDENEGVSGPTVEFDPGARVIPFPNNLLLDPATGKLNLPQQCNESAATTATRTNVLNKLDGFGTYEPVINVTFTEPVDVASLDGRVLLFQRASAGEANDPLTAIPIPVIVVSTQTVRFTNQENINACTDPVMVDQLTFIPRVPLEQKSTYTVALLAGIKTANGDDFNPSFTWSIVREPDPVVALDEAGNVVLNRTPLDPAKPEDLAQIQGIDLLWNAHHNAITFLAGTGHDSSELLLAWEFNTQTVTDPLDPAVEGSPASTPTALPLLGNISASTAAAGTRQGAFQQCIPDDPISDTECFLRVALGAGNYAVGKATCAAAGCAAVNDVLGSILLSKQYRADVDNVGYTGTGAAPIPGAWSDPIAPTVVHDTSNPNPLLNDAQAKLEALVLIPQGAAPAEGFPVVVFQHGITRSKTDVFGVMGALTSQGFAVVAIDASNHGSRAVRISNVANAIPALDCTDVGVGLTGPRPDRGPDPTTNVGCYAPIFSSDLAATRDGFRQSVLDIQQLVTSLKACGTTACGKLKVDATKIAYLGHSMGSILGGMAVGTTPDIQASVLDVGGVGWVDILENTQQVVGFQCPLVDALIDAGSLTCGGAPCTEADKFDPIANTGLCLTDAWKLDPGYRQFAVIGRWVLDPADPANYMQKLAATRFLIQRVDDDEVVPNIATDNMGALVQQLKADATCGIPVGTSIPPSSALVAGLGQSHFLDYVSVPPGTAGCPVGNTYGHGSLLQPEDSVTGGTCNPGTGASCDGTFATVRLQTDMVFFFLSNLDLL
jgi:pimeloyl-ACP methyl ester carboxylesterase